MLDPPLAQRVAFKFTLKPLSAEATESYINYRLQVAGSKESPFEAETLALIHRLAGGVPRLINTICDNALFETYLRRSNKVSSRIINNVAEDFGLLDAQSPPLESEQESAVGDEEIEMIFDDLEGK